MKILLLAAAVSGLVSGLSLFAAYDVLIDDPAVAAIERARCAAEVEAAAARATAAEQARQFRIGERAFQRAYEQDQEDRAWQEAQVRLLQSEIDDHERDRAAGGRACPLDDSDLRFLGLGGLQLNEPAD